MNVKDLGFVNPIQYKNCIIIVRTVHDFFVRDLYEFRETDCLLERNLFLVDGICYSDQVTCQGKVKVGVGILSVLLILFLVMFLFFFFTWGNIFS